MLDKVVKDLGAHDWGWNMLSIRADNVEFTLVGLSDSELGKPGPRINSGYHVQVVCSIIFEASLELIDTHLGSVLHI